MKRILLWSLLGLLSWYPSDFYSNGTPIAWDDCAWIVYQPAIANSAYGPWTNLTVTDYGATWADVPDPAEGKTLYYSCRAIMCKNFICGQPSGYAVPLADTTPRIKGRGKNK
jgi:hypothetical protein